MREERSGFGGVLLRFWKTRKGFRGFGLLLFYCHMLMLFSVLARGHFGGMPEYAALLSLGKLVPVLFTLTTFSLFMPRLFWGGLGLGFLHLPVAAFFILSGPAGATPWLAGLAGLALLLFYTLYTKIQD